MEFTAISEAVGRPDGAYRGASALINSSLPLPSTGTRLLSTSDVRPLVTVAQSVEIQTWAFRQLGLGLAWNSSNQWIDARFADIPLPTVGKVMTGGMEPDWLGSTPPALAITRNQEVEVQLLTLFRAGSLQPVAVMEASSSV